jgi:ureidoglycolate hydrolase
MNNMLRILTRDSFEPFGTILEWDFEHSESSFQVLVREAEAPGWQIAISKPSAGPVTVLGLHPDTRESFEPLSGCALLLVAEKDSPEKVTAFVLNKPVCLFKDVWHATMALTKETLLKITENSEVSSQQYALSQPIRLD